MKQQRGDDAGAHGHEAVLRVFLVLLGEAGLFPIKRLVRHGDARDAEHERQREEDRKRDERRKREREERRKRREAEEQKAVAERKRKDAIAKSTGTQSGQPGSKGPTRIGVSGQWRFLAEL